MVFTFLLASPCKAGELWFEAGVGHDRKAAEGRSPQSVLRFRYEMENKAWWTPDVLELNHHSSVLDGRPFNSHPEDTTDQLSVIWRFKLL
jgi:hypothetical protein